jgi:RNAse (barnase) inhibitor barstar
MSSASPTPPPPPSPVGSPGGASQAPRALPVDFAGLAAFETAATRDGCRLLRADLSAARDRDGVFAALARGLALPDYFGANLDALYDCLTDLEPGKGGIAIALAGMPRLPQRELDGLLSVFADAIEAWDGRGVALRVAYTLSGGVSPG